MEYNELGGGRETSKATPPCLVACIRIRGETMDQDIRILVVDDSKPMREFVVQAIEGKEGFIAIQATDGEEGLEKALASPPPDLILLDLEMPRMGGFEVVEALR